MIELIKLNSNTEEFHIFHNSAVLVATAQEENVEVLLNTLILQSPTHVGFIGASSDHLCFLFDDMLAQTTLNIVTTTHTEGMQEAIWEFLNVYAPLNSESGHFYLIESGECDFISFYKKKYKNEF